jgi:hypothetical protein
MLPKPQRCLWTAIFFAMALYLPPVDANSDFEFFEKKIRPILVDNCYKCHSSKAEKGPKGGLLLDSKEGLLKGGDSGPAIVPEHPDKSLLIKAIRYTDENLQMPPKGKKLGAEQIADLETWIKSGAPDPRTATGSLDDANTIRAKAKNHWAFQSVHQPAAPAVKNRLWVKTPVDAFILARLEAKGLKPSPPCDKRTLIRRATFDLTGLPPAPEDVAAFLKDKSSDAFAKVVDRLLASPRYGERWARHWLDVARYADTKGYLAGNEERRFPYSYTYRDYVIRAFNEDLPYDQFLLQQIAADQLDTGSDKRPLAAMGFLTLGRRFLNNPHDIIDDRLDVVTRGTQALTVTCARCHDHKYDPIPTKDYYSLYGVFASSHEPDERPLLGIDAPKEQHDKYLAEKKRREKVLEDYRNQKIAEATADSHRRAADYLMGALELSRLPDKSQLDTVAREKKLEPGLVQKWMAALDRWKAQSNSMFQAWFVLAELPATNFVEQAKILSAQLATNGPPPIAQAFTNPPASLKAVAEAYGKTLNDTEQRWQQFVQAQQKEGKPVPTALPDPDWEQIRQALNAPDSPWLINGDEAARLYDVPTIEQIREFRRQIVELDAIHPGAPPRAMALMDNGSPSSPHVFIRGNPHNTGPEVPRQFLEILSGTNRQPFQKGSGRLELAQSIANRNNPLTARVMVNRVWLQHFGRGLVATPSDFGLRSDPPTHPELLDWLAWHFMEEGWSIKKLHRRIMLSAVYQQTSDENPAAAKIDPANLLWWKMNRHRLEFEALRDSLLAASGKLDPTMGGQPVDIIGQPFSARRSVYGYIDRQNLPGVLRTFDFASPDTTSSQRFFTTVPQQALFLLNSPFVVEQARSLVTNTLFQKISREPERVDFLYRKLFQREPDKTELKSALHFVHVQSTNQPLPGSKFPWLYGYGEFDSAGKKVRNFTLFPHFTGKRWQNSEEFPDTKTGYAMLDIEGGHPGNRLQHAAIRRWISPFDGIVRIEGLLHHIMDKGDGVLARVVSSRNGEVGKWVSFNSQTNAVLEKCEVRRGDTLDFVVDARTGPAHDSFKWAPIIRVVEVTYGKPAPERTEWNSQKDFDGPPRDTRPLNAWEKYVQVLLLSNEFMFVD